MYLGTGNPGTHVPEHRYHGSLDINNLFFVENITNIETIKKIHETDINNLNKIEEYKNLIFNYDFDTVNNQGIIFDNSSNNYFVEKVPNQFIQ